MADLNIPRTPSPTIPISKSGGFTSLTPPPTTQAIRHASFISAPERRSQNAKSVHKLGRLPTVDEAQSFSAEECRDSLLEVLPILGETRMTLAHTQLQLNLLSIEATEAAQRAEVEYEMMRREAEVLRAGSPILQGRRANFGDHSSFPHMQRQLEAALEAGRDLEADNYQLKNRLRQAKRIIKQLSGQKIQLSEDNHLLRQRIKQNRAHVDATRPVDTSPNTFLLPRTRPNKPIRSATPAQNPLDALLMADQILSGNPSSMPATPSPHRLHRQRNGHTRGVQSLSSLPSTPTRRRRMSATDLAVATPANRITYPNPATASYTAPARHSREDRDGTISASEDEALTDDETITASQASQVATSMLKSNPTSGGVQYPWMRPVASNTTAPTALMRIGAVSQSSGIPAVVKSVGDGKEDRPRKRTKTVGGHVGLGIREFGSPA